ncbi:glycoside hydrolase domain-containing protein [Paenibacillus sp. HJGM_3]|uniref:glycoside hydrolase domain-containing protein n=1 Tax=Paenibacillus sp. HJGM_3 TaxID=3379816 RepID=UPI00385C3237
MKLGQVMKELTGLDAPPSLLEYSAAFEEWRQANERTASFDRMPKDAALIYDLPQEAMKPIAELYPVIAADERLSLLGSFWHYMIFYEPPGTGGNASAWPLPDLELGNRASIWPLAVLVSGSERASEAYNKLGVSTKIAMETLAFGGLYTRDYYKRYGRWGLSELGWLRHHVHARIFRLGRLVFNPVIFHWPFLTVRNRATGAMVTLCDGDVRYRGDGLPDGTNNRREPDAWRPILQRSDSLLAGHPVTPEGIVQQEPIELDPKEWEEVLAKGDPVVDVHIPSGSKLSEAECEEAYEQAYTFFAHYFPSVPFRAFICKSWIMDPALARILPPESKLVKFQRRFDPLPVIGDERQTYDLVFEQPDIDLSTFTPVTSLQRAIIDYVKRGNLMRSSAGFTLWPQTNLHMLQPSIMPLPAALQFDAVHEDAYVAFWLQTSLKRVFPKSAPEGGSQLSLTTARNARISFQACLKNNRPLSLQVECEAEAPNGIGVQVRRVGWVPQAYLSEDVPLEELDGSAYIPGFVPDPLYPDRHAKISAFTNQAFWITVQIPERVKPGQYRITVSFSSPSFTETMNLSADIEVKSVIIGKRRSFPVTHWWNADCIYDWYGQRPFGDESFEWIAKYLKNMVDHGCDTIYVPLFNIRSPEIMERPPQLLIVTEEPGKYSFDWERVRKFVDLAKELGFERFEWTHLWSYGSSGGRMSTPTRIYTERNGSMELLFPEDLDGGGEIYRHFLSVLLPEFKRFLLEEGILEQSFFHVSDEPKEIENYKKSRDLLKELAPWMKVVDAIYKNTSAAIGLMDAIIPDARSANAFVEKRIPHWVYYCVIPRGRYINRLFDTPLIKVRMQGLVFYRLRTLGFLHWGYNYWYRYCEGQQLVDPYTDGAAGQKKLPYGDAFVVYPGEDGPVDSIRWEIFAEGLQDYALLQTLGVDPDDERLGAIHNYSDFPRSEDWLHHVLQSVMQ